MGIKEYLGNYGTSDLDVPPIAGTFTGKNLVVVGDAHCVWDDLEAYGCRQDFQRGKVFKDEQTHFLLVNKIGEVFPGNFQHWYSNEPAVLKKYIEARRPEYGREFGTAFETHSVNKGMKWRWPFGGHETSGLGGCLVGVGLGYDKVVICGIPLDNGNHNGEPHWRNCRFEASEAVSPVDGGMNNHWQRAKEFCFDGKVRSMSGRTAEWLGTP